MKVYNPDGYSYITIVQIPKTEISKFDMALCTQPRQTLKKFYDSCETKPAIICNGGFFNMTDGSTLMTYSDEGVIIHSDSKYTEGMGTVDGELVFGTIGEKDFTDFVSGYPVLIKEGKEFIADYAGEIDYKARRTVLAYDAKNIYIIAVESPGMAFDALREFLLTLDVEYAINLDGGGSTKILKDGTSITSTAYNRAVDNVVAVWLKPTVLYRVQVGAYSKKDNANIMLAKIHVLEDTIGAGYAKAYVRKVGSYYKVQIGAFSVKANATRVVNDLKNKGFSAFITTT